MDSRILSVIYDEAKRVYPDEACGLIVVQGKRGIAVPCANVSDEPTKFFMIDPVEYARVAKTGEIVGVWHTHPEGTSDASGFDLSGVESTAVEWVIIGVAKRGDEFIFAEPKSYRPTGYEAPYIERPYIVGIYDCYALVRDYYKREFGIELGGYVYAERWWEGEGKRNLFIDHFKEEGFVEVMDSEPRVGDLFLTQTGADIPNHIAIYIGDDKILHHCYDRLSRIDVYGGGYWWKHTTHHIRHRSKCLPM